MYLIHFVQAVHSISRGKSCARGRVPHCVHTNTWQWRRQSQLEQREGLRCGKWYLRPCSFHSVYCRSSKRHEDDSRDYQSISHLRLSRSRHTIQSGVVRGYPPRLNLRAFEIRRDGRGKGGQEGYSGNVFGQIGLNHRCVHIFNGYRQVTPQSVREEKMFSYKLVLSDINKFATCKAERAGCRWADRSMQCLCSRHSVRPCARRKLRPHRRSKKGKTCNALKRHRTSLCIETYFQLSREKMTHNKTKTRARERRKGTVKVRVE